MVQRLEYQELTNRLQHTPAVVLVGSRQVGKTTLARSVDVGKPIVYIGLERPSDVAKLSDPELYLSSLGGQLVILDEIKRMPELFPQTIRVQSLRELITSLALHRKR